MDETVKAYLAGIVDGEGTVTLTRNHRNELHSPVVSVSNTDLQLLKWIQARVGGIITSKRVSKSHHTVSYVWRLRQNKAIDFLQEIKKYLIVKRRQTELIIRDYKKVTHRAGKYTPELLDKKADLVERIRALNKR